jgi:hypothetical protein
MDARFCVAMLMACCLSISLAQTQPQANQRKPLAPGEQAPPANPGQRNFGGPPPPVRHRRTETAADGAAGSDHPDGVAGRAFHERSLRLC